MLLKLLEVFSRKSGTREGKETHSSQNLLIWDCTEPGDDNWKVLYEAPS